MSESLLRALVSLNKEMEMHLTLERSLWGYVRTYGVDVQISNRYANLAYTWRTSQGTVIWGQRIIMLALQGWMASRSKTLL